MSMISGETGEVNTTPDKYLRAETALRLISASGHLVSSHEKIPIYPSNVDWPITCLDCNIDKVIWAWREWGDGVRGPGAFMGETRLALDFDPFSRVANGDAKVAEKRKEWRDGLEAGLIKRFYGENSRGLTGKHFICAVDHSFAGRRGIDLLKKHYAIDVLTGSRYCDITGDRINDCGMIDGTEIIEDLLAQVEAAFPDNTTVANGGGANGTYPIPCLRELLTFVRVPLDDRKGWTGIGMALHTETAGSDDGLSLWDEWSRATGGEKYTSLTTSQSCGRGSTSRAIPVPGS